MRRLARQVLALGLIASLAPAFCLAAEPSPDPLAALATDASAVLGAGADVRLQVTEDDHGAASTRTLGVGDDYRDGWKITAITPTAVTLAKSGQTRTVALEGRRAPAPDAAAPPSTGKLALSNALPGGTPTIPDQPFDARNLTSAELIQRLSAAGLTDTGAVNANGYGVRTINLRNLGAGRTLVLFDGVRLADDPATGMPPAP